MIDLSKYIKIRNNYCICYFGPIQDFIQQLIKIRPLIEKESGLKIYLSIRDDFMYLAKSENRIIAKSEIKNSKALIGHFREIEWDLTNNPVEALLSEIGKSLT